MANADACAMCGASTLDDLDIQTTGQFWSPEAQPKTSDVYRSAASVLPDLIVRRDPVGCLSTRTDR